MGINFRGGRRFLVLLCAVIMGLVVLAFIPNRNSQNFIRDDVQDYDLAKPEIASQRFSRIKVLKPDEVGAIYDDFTVIWSNAKTDFQKYGSYKRLYGILRAKYNVTKDMEVRAEMDAIEKFIIKEWPLLYKTDKDNKGFIE